MKASKSLFKPNLGSWNDIKHKPILGLLNLEGLGYVDEDTFRGWIRTIAGGESSQDITFGNLGINSLIIVFKALFNDSQNEVKETTSRTETLDVHQPIPLPKEDYALMATVIQGHLGNIKDEVGTDTGFLLRVHQDSSKAEREFREINENAGKNVIDPEIIENLSKCNESLANLGRKLLNGEVVDGSKKHDFEKALRGGEITKLSNNKYRISFGENSQNTAEKAIAALFKNDSYLQKQPNIGINDSAQLSEDGKSVIYTLHSSTRSQTAACLNAIHQESQVLGASYSVAEANQFAEIADGVVKRYTDNAPPFPREKTGQITRKHFVPDLDSHYETRATDKPNQFEFKVVSLTRYWSGVTPNDSANFLAKNLIKHLDIEPQQIKVEDGSVIVSDIKEKAICDHFAKKSLEDALRKCTVQKGSTKEGVVFNIQVPRQNPNKLLSNRKSHSTPSLEDDRQVSHSVWHGATESIAKAFKACGGELKNSTFNNGRIYVQVSPNSELHAKLSELCKQPPLQKNVGLGV